MIIIKTKIYDYGSGGGGGEGYILLKYLNDNYQNNFISGILDIDKINTLLSNELLMGHYQPLWQLIQVLLVKQILDKDNLFRFDKNKKIAPIF